MDFLCFAQTDGSDFIQFYVKAPVSGNCVKGAEIAIYALNQQGLIAKDYSGKKEVFFEITEEGGKAARSYFALPKEELDFKEGSANFLIRDSEEETLNIKVREGAHASPFPAVIAFKFSQAPVAFAIDLDKKGVLNKPKIAAVSAIDKDGNVVYEYNNAGIAVMVKESGMQDKSYVLEPKELIFKEGVADFSISDSEEKEVLTIKVTDLSGKLKPAEADIIFDIEDAVLPKISEIKMETLAFVEIIFSEELEDAPATDPYNYEVVCVSTQRPRNVEFHKNKVILELNELLQPYEQMYVVVKNIKDLTGNVIESGSRSPSYAVPKLPIRIELEASASTSSISTPVNINVSTKCISGRTPHFINGNFSIEVSEAVSDKSFSLPSQEVRITKGIGSFTISDSASEKLTVTVRDPGGMADSATIELNFS